MRTPIKDLRYVTKSLSALKKIIPPESRVETFLLFSGNIEINLAEADRRVTAHTTKLVIYDFWKSMTEAPEIIAEIAEHIYPFEDEKLFNVFQEKYHKSKDPYVRAALFFLLNRCSSDGMISHGKLESKNYNPVALSHIKRFNPINFNVEYDDCDDFMETIRHTEDADYIFLPVGKFGYNFLEEGINRGPEETSVYHKDLKEVVGATTIRTIINYQYHPEVLKLYKDYDIMMLDKYGRQTSEEETAEELIIANFRIN